MHVRWVSSVFDQRSEYFVGRRGRVEVVVVVTAFGREDVERGSRTVASGDNGLPLFGADHCSGRVNAVDRRLHRDVDVDDIVGEQTAKVPRQIPVCAGREDDVLGGVFATIGADRKVVTLVDNLFDAFLAALSVEV